MPDDDPAVHRISTGAPGSEDPWLLAMEAQTVEIHRLAAGQEKSIEIRVDQTALLTQIRDGLLRLDKIEGRLEAIERHLERIAEANSEEKKAGTATRAWLRQKLDDCLKNPMLLGAFGSILSALVAALTAIIAYYVHARWGASIPTAPVSP
jgi:DNA-binding FrmR family transcriptional regulator